MITILLALIITVIVFKKYQPYIDVTRNGDWLLWYNKGEERVYKILHRSEG